jgi:16S rRNA (guanine527-N7)-methyltransferase
VTTPQTDVPAPPRVAQLLFADRLPVVEKYVALLATAGMERGLIGPREVPRLWERHILNSAVVADLIGRERKVIDLGSGAGLPGMAVAILRPDLSMVLLEPLLRRSQFLAEALETLQLRNVSCRRSRAEDVAGQVSADVVLARAVAPLDRLARWALPLLVDGGELLAIKGQAGADEAAAADTTMRRLGAQHVDVVVVGESVVQPPTTVVRVRMGSR